MTLAERTTPFGGIIGVGHANGKGITDSTSSCIGRSYLYAVWSRHQRSRGVPEKGLGSGIKTEPGRQI
ncbi:MAG: hypothetical protein Ct9H300mP4_06500 [Gammaproteobacteria bacterium]|nr:MAG: hypothetical protein Ct9H300mP4_06500 [Gammaproteobacteria bacterium]